MKNQTNPAARISGSRISHWWEKMKTPHKNWKARSTYCFWYSDLTCYQSHMFIECFIDVLARNFSGKYFGLGWWNRFAGSRTRLKHYQGPRKTKKKKEISVHQKLTQAGSYDNFKVSLHTTVLHTGWLLTILPKSSFTHPRVGNRVLLIDRSF